MSNNGNSGSGIDVTLSSGFTVRVKPLPPYYIDVIDEILPLPEFPTRKIVLAAGDITEWPYEPEEAAADPKHEDYALYMKWKAVEREKIEIVARRDNARKDFLLSNCITVVNGPLDFHSDGWVNSVEAAFEDYEVPEHPGKRMLVFLKTQVITTAEELEILIKYALSQEVSLQGIIRALQGFQHQMEESKLVGHNRKTSKRKS